MKNAIILGSFVIVFGIGTFLLFGQKKNEQKKSIQSSKPVVTSVSPTQKEGITLGEIAKHKSASDCWFAVEGKAYDATSFIASGMHPGGEAILLGCGKDATSIFNKRPKSGTPHSQRARESLQNYYIGVLIN